MKNEKIDHWLAKMRWETATKEYGEINMFQIDCFKFYFKQDGLSQEQQNILLKFMGDSETLNSRTVVDFCNMFLQNNIFFILKYKFYSKRNLKDNFASWEYVKYVNKQLKKITDGNKIQK